MAQTLTCNIGDVVTDVTVSWKDNGGNDITTGSGGYTIAQGSADSGTKIQTSTLTIDVDTLTSVAGGATPRSTRYPWSWNVESCSVFSGSCRCRRRRRSR